MKHTAKRVCALFLVNLLMLTGCGQQQSGEQLLAEGIKNLENGQYRTATINLKNYLRTQPDSIDARIALGKTMLKQGDADTAEKELLHARKLGAAPEDYLVPWAMALSQRNAYAELLVEIDPDLVKEPENLAIITALQAVATYELDPRSTEVQNDVQARFEKVIGLDANSEANRTALMGQAKIASDQGRLQDAEILIRRALGEAPESIESALLLGQNFMKQEKHSDAEEILAYALANLRSNESEKAMLNSALIEALLEQDRTADALDIAKNYTADGIKHPVSGYLLGRAQFEHGEIDNALETLQKTDTKFPGDPRTQALLGATLLNRGQLEQAEMNLSSSLSSQPDNLTVRQLLAETRMRLDRPEDAAATLRDGLGRGQDSATLIAALGRASMSLGNKDDAIDLLKQYVADNPNDPQLIWSLASAYYGAGRLEEARRVFNSMPEGSLLDHHRNLLLTLSSYDEKDAAVTFSELDTILASAPDDAGVLNVVGSFYLSIGELQKARTQFERLLALDSLHHDAIINLSRIDARLGQHARSTSNLERYLDAHPNDLLTLLAMARIAQYDGKQDVFMELIQRANQAHPDALTPNLIIANRDSRNGEAEIAENRAQVAVNTHRTAHRGHATLAQILMRTGKIETALKSIRKAVELNPGYTPYLMFEGRLHKRLRNYDAAQSSFESALKSEPVNVAAVRELIALAIRNSDMKSAQDYVSQLEKRLPNHPDTLELAGDMHAVQKQYTRASASYRRAANARPSQPLAAKEFRMNVLAGKTNPMEPMLAWLEEHPDDLATRLILADDYDDRLKQPAKAIELYESVLERSGQNILALNNLAWLYLKRNQPDDKAWALDLAERAYGVLPNDFNVADTYGWTLYHNDQSTKSVDVLTKALAMTSSTKSPEVAYHLAAALLKDGKYDKGKTLLKETLDSSAQFDQREEAANLFNSL
ncbi:MAG: XrtA/PEP-CTERM system TPR-repeat protein PrsT [Gammaproteobacteria bacterium]